MSQDGLHPTEFGHRQRLAIAHDEVIDHPHIDERQCIAEPASQLPIGLARLGHAGWMVVRQNDRCGVMGQGTFDHLAGVNAGPVDGAVKQRCSSI